ncbi:FAD-dependent oxidoreductase [Paralimibaculum aggregatum]|uniref:FAD-dependent oxidoreductase n=1 Tax=Paralimibaculum aggregatum TaxID=3036245 RepID=A0ABQ6LQX8_9RHOB|nr:FAD-dependent oxidoreductase [Limibaculum sp. NKW23]GMG83200.1 FAD-dependent oxidoreductase [Limibaculum sp. NKW23]
MPDAGGQAPVLTPDLCVIGAGSGGLSLAAGAVQMGASVVLVEAGRMGGDCLNYGCVPSKALLAAAKRAEQARRGGLGVAPAEPQIDYAGAMAHVQAAIDAIAPHDSQERFERLGCTVIRAAGRFVSPREVEAGGQRIRARRFVVATGSGPFVPPIPGLAETPHLTNETLWELRERPGHLAILGGGPIGMEMAQAHVRLGCRVTVIEAATPLGGHDPELAAVALDRLRAEGVEIVAGKAERVSGAPGAVTLHLEGGGEVSASHLLVATGRRPNLERLDLAAGEVEHTPRGVTVDKGLRSTSNSRVYAIGDAAGGLQFTHVASYHAGLVVRSALFRLPVRAKDDHLPKVTFTDPEIAEVGLTEAGAATRGETVEIHRAPFSGNDRAIAEGETEGLVKLIASPKGRILGAGIAGPHAGELIQIWSLALSKGLRVKDISGHVAAYPTLGESAKQAAGAYFRPRLFESPMVKRVVRLLAHLG